jgi:taurine dioxygenase
MNSTVTLNPNSNTNATTSTKAQSIVVSPLSPNVGARVDGIDLRNPLSPEHLNLIKQAWYEGGVVCFPNQLLTEVEQVAFGQNFGELAHTQGEYAISKTHPAIMYVTNEKENGKYVGALPDGEMFFHSDMCYVEKPSMATMLFAIHIPKVGGNTLFANMYKAYEALSAEIREKINHLSAVNSYEPGLQAPTSVSRKSAHRSQETKSYVHPMVCTHPETKRKALYVNRLMTESVVGLSDKESDDLLQLLFEHQERKEFIYEHHWSIGDLLMWDNRCVLHARSDFNADELRKLRRITVKGDKIQS